MTGRLESVMAELKTLGAVLPERSSPVTVQPPPEHPVTEALPPPDPPIADPPPADPDVPAVDADVEAKIRALSEGFPTALQNADDAFEPESAETPVSEEEAPVEESSPEESPEERPDPAPRPRRSVAARRLKEAFARLELLEACSADLRDALQAVAASIQEET